MLGSDQVYALAVSSLKKDAGASPSNSTLCFNLQSKACEKDVFIMASTFTAEVIATEFQTRNKVTWFCRGVMSSTPPNIEAKLGT
jgi:hypothetical protein